MFSIFHLIYLRRPILDSQLEILDFTIVNTALPAIAFSLNASVTQLSWLITIFMIALSSLMVVMVRVADLHGRRLVLYISMLTFGVSSFFCWIGYVD